MRVVKVTSKGQVTIPIEVREQLGISDDSYLEVSVVGDAITLRTRARARVLADDDPIWELVGVAASGGDDASSDHDRYLAEGEMKRWRRSS
jgi:AbrB family looped-hinge helix DNA binding protein